jgi:hypothetical protein
MIDVDLIADNNAETGLPDFDDKSSASRWLDALDAGITTSTAEATTLPHYYDTHSQLTQSSAFLPHMGTSKAKSAPLSGILQQPTTNQKVPVQLSQLTDVMTQTSLCFREEKRSALVQRNPGSGSRDTNAAFICRAILSSPMRYNNFQNWKKRHCVVCKRL